MSESKVKRKGKKRVSQQPSSSTKKPKQENVTTSGKNVAKKKPKIDLSTKPEVDDEEEGNVTNLLGLRQLLNPNAVTISQDGQEKDLKKVEAVPKPKIDTPTFTSRYHIIPTDSPEQKLEDLPMAPLHPKIVHDLTRAGISSFFPVQSAVVPMLLNSGLFDDRDSPYTSDICVSVPTGQGKTLAYVVPMVQHALMQKEKPSIRGLVVLPTRDLALQVAKVFGLFCRPSIVGKKSKRREIPPYNEFGRQLRYVTLTGESSFGEECAGLNSSQGPPDFLICTSGRLAEHLSRKQVQMNFENLRWIVVDEADRLLTIGNQRILNILTSLGQRKSSENNFSIEKPQKLLFSATMTSDPQKIATLQLNRPLFFFSTMTGEFQVPETLTQYMSVCSNPDEKLYMLVYLVHRLLEGPLYEPESGRNLVRAASVAPSATTKVDDERDSSNSSSSESEDEEDEKDDNFQPLKMLIFCSSVDASHKVARLLQLFQTSSDSKIKSKRKPLAVHEFSSSLGQSARSTILADFKKPLGDKALCLVCSDVMTRGIDVSDCDVVINFDMPSRLPTYLHRVGRTARAGRTGTAITLLEKSERNNFKSMLRKCFGAWDSMYKYECPADLESEYGGVFETLNDLLVKVLEKDAKGHGDLVINAKDFE